ncbi:MAG: hypothetical protein P0Y64_02100 [Candidatus Sphingomonas colombiensis]|nr:hypothetical protein [Sphingomonas sp.]WEK43648.1 MAG: hypothetical protein P0Y64_02100 [Sphingomonas sp.]
MPAERGYEQQLGTGAPVAGPRADPSAFGAGIGAGMVGIADSLHRGDMTDRAIARQQTADSEAASVASRLAKLREAADKASADARNNAGPGGASHADQMRAWLDEQSKGVLDGITDHRVLRAAQGQLAEFGSRFNSSEYQWQEGRRVGKIVTDMGNARDVSANRAQRLSDPQAFAEELSLGRQSIEALQGVPADIKDKLIHEHDEAVTVGFFNGMIDRDPRSVTGVLDSGAFDTILSSAQMERLRKGAKVEVHRLDAAAKADAAHQLSLTKEALATRRAELETGAGKPQDWDDLASRYDAIGDTSSGVTARAKGAGMAATISYRAETLPQLDSRIADLTAKRNGGGLSAQEASTLSGLTDLRGQLNGMLGQPGGPLLAYQFASGKPIAPIDPTDPASMRARASQAKAAAAQYGRSAPEPLLPTELPTFRDLVDGGAQQKLQALQMIQGFGDPQVIRAASAQIAGDDGAFRIASQLPASVARSVLLGGETLKAAPQVLKPKPGQRDARGDFGLWFGRNRLLTSMGGSYSNDVFEAARALYGQRAAEAGLDHYDSGRFAEAIETALGKQPGPDGPTGGIARHGAGMVLVPQGMKPDALLQSFARASADDYARASGGRVPHWSDGTTLRRSELVRALPTAIDGAGHYGFRSTDGRLINDDQGKPYVVDITRLGK